MRWFVMRIVEVIHEQKTFKKHVRTDDWTVERAIIANNVNETQPLLHT